MNNNHVSPMLMKIEAMRPGLSKSELIVCDYILAHPDEVIRFRACGKKRCQ